MPIVRIDYEKTQVTEEEIHAIVAAVQGFAADVTGYEPKDISVFASENQITANAAPLELYIHATFPDVTESEMESMLENLASHIATFKKEHAITIPFNLSVVKMQWKFKLEV